MTTNTLAANFGDAGCALDADGAVVRKAKVIRVKASDFSGTTEKALTFKLPARSIVYGAFINVITAEATAATKTLDVGTLSSSGGDADGLLDGVSVAATGLQKGTLLSTGQTLGALLRADESGTTGFVPEPYINASEIAVSVTAGSSGFANLVADLIIYYDEITSA